MKLCMYVVPIFVLLFSGNSQTGLAQSDILLGGTSSGGDQPVGFAMDCSDTDSRMVLHVRDSGEGTAELKLKDGADEETLFTATSRLMWGFMASSERYEIYLNFLRAEDKVLLLSLNLERPEDVETYKATFFTDDDDNPVQLFCRAVKLDGEEQ